MVPKMNQRMIGVIGTGVSAPQTDAHAEAVGRLLAQRGYSMVCGGRDGVMRAAARGFQTGKRNVDHPGIVVGVLPADDPSSGNGFLDVAIPTGMGEARNTIIINTAVVFIAIGLGFGTLSEIAFALRQGKTVVGLGSWDVHPDIVPVSTPEDAVATAIRALPPAGDTD